MNHKPSPPASGAGSGFARLVEEKAARKLRAQREGDRGVWFGLGMFGLIGWSVALPTVLGAFLGAWWDRHHHVPHSWTLMLLAIGLTSGCANAWHWVVSEDRAVQEEDENE